MKKIMLIFGTRPEAVKMCPLVRALRERGRVQTVVCVTGQHRGMLDGVLAAFGVRPDYDLDIMTAGQTLFDVTARVLLGVREVLEKEHPDMVAVHGDTTTAYAAALGAFYLHIPVAHVEAGLRTHDMAQPFPEEFNRQSVSLMADWHFAPTAAAAENLLQEGKGAERVFVTGNTAIDALRYTVRQDFAHPLLEWARGGRLVLLTAHRRENLGRPLEQMLRAARRVAKARADVRIIYPVHMNPVVREAAEKVLGGQQNIRLVPPLDVVDFHNILARSYLVLTDSGGIQEEAPALGKPVLVMRQTTERPEGVAAGTLKLVGCEEQGIYESTLQLLDDAEAYAAMASAINPYGDGHAAEHICEQIEQRI